MESHLGVQRGSNDGDLMASLEQRSNAMEVDGLAEESASRESVKVTRMYWELVDENKVRVHLMSTTSLFLIRPLD